MENETFEKFRWTIKNFSKLESEKIYSENFILGGYTWKILMFPKGNKWQNAENNLSIYLDAGNLANLPYGGSRFANFRLSLINHLSAKFTVTKETRHDFTASESDWGFSTFMPLHEFCDTSNGFIVNNTCIIEVEISTSKSEYENKVVDAEICAKVAEVEICDNKPEYENKVVEAEICASQPEAENKVDEVVSKIDNGQVCDEPNELVDFKGLGKIEKTFVPLLEEVCSCYPTLVECQQNRSRRFREWAFTALGRVLHFLKNKKVKDMNDDDASNHLQILWEELETFRFDLAWLESHVQSALATKSYIERADEVKKLKENVAALEMETKRLRAKMTAAKVDLEIARRELVKAEEGFEERNLDAPLGYGELQICVT